MILLSFTGTALPSKDIILIRRARLAYSFDITRTAMRKIITHNTLLQILIEVIIFRADITGTNISAFQTPRWTGFACNWLQCLMIQAISFFALVAIGAITDGAFWTTYLALQLLIFVVTDRASFADVAVGAFEAIVDAGDASFIGRVEVVGLHTGEAGGGIVAAMAPGEGVTAGWAAGAVEVVCVATAGLAFDVIDYLYACVAVGYYLWADLALLALKPSIWLTFTSIFLWLFFEIFRGIAEETDRRIKAYLAADYIAW